MRRGAERATHADWRAHHSLDAESSRVVTSRCRDGGAIGGEYEAPSGENNNSKRRLLSLYQRPWHGLDYQILNVRVQRLVGRLPMFKVAFGDYGQQFHRTHPAG